MPKGKTVTKCLANGESIEDRRSKRQRKIDRTMRVVNMLDFLRDSNKKYDGSPPKLVRRQMRATSG